MNSFKKIFLIGSGNIAHNIAWQCIQHEIQIVGVYSRDIQNAADLANIIGCDFTDSVDKINSAEADLFIIAVADNAIMELSKIIRLNKKFIVHTSGATDIDVLKDISENYGAFYPLQTMNKEFKCDFKSIPLCVWANTNENILKLYELASIFSNSVYKTDDKKRALLHLAAVFASNYTNFMYSASKKILDTRGLEFEMLHPLIEETTRRALLLDPASVQTGPAIRKDTVTIEKHIHLLDDEKNLKALYTFLSDMIQNTKF